MAVQLALEVIILFMVLLAAVPWVAYWRGQSPLKWMLLSAAITPILGLVLLAWSPVDA